MEVCEQIRRERGLGSTRCGIADGALSVVEVARAFGLIDSSAIYRPIGLDEAEAIATHMLQVDLAYGSNIMSLSRAMHLWRQFVALLDEEEVTFATNVAEGLSSWTPATGATFDRGVLVIGTTKVGCLWVEDED